MEHFVKALSTQPNIVSVKLSIIYSEVGCVSILCDGIGKHNSRITNFSLYLMMLDLSNKDVRCIEYLVASCTYLESLTVTLSGSRKQWDLSRSFYTAMCKTKSLQKLVLPHILCRANSEVFGNIVSRNCSLKELCVTVATADCLGPILNGLLTNTSITTLRVYISDKKINQYSVISKQCNSDPSNMTGQYLEFCLTNNHSLIFLDFTDKIFLTHVSWSSTQVRSICTGLCANTTVVTLDISGCYIDTEACHALCGMFLENTTLQHLFLNPVQLEKQEAIAMINSCSANSALELLSLVQWPPKGLRNDIKGKEPFQYSCDPEINHMLLTIQKLRQERDKPLLNVYWLVSFHCIDVLLST